MSLIRLGVYIAYFDANQWPMIVNKQGLDLLLPPESSDELVAYIWTRLLCRFVLANK